MTHGNLVLSLGLVEARIQNGEVDFSRRDFDGNKPHS